MATTSSALMTTSPRSCDLGDRIDHSLRHLHTLPGLNARVIGRAIGVPPARVAVTHWLLRHTTVRASVARLRLEAAERILREQSPTLPKVVMLERAAESAGFRSTDEMNRAFLRYRHRSGIEVLLSGRVGSSRTAARRLHSYARGHDR
ncbi:hypothetical protein [Rathayibacter sp. VKM Ac-2754]|uniref:hypothetical protein n=1 Tax=Rathayibacter sp. VKM Ac-2754 TaxID=2609251 RepID=UPI001359A041|nr:hypothetical protein [Rathayibacter sp. VKM Ac-2754]MWV58773.1 hypothetical protein [Rathayibacter sp. VKM Ac-2754]